VFALTILPLLSVADAKTEDEHYSHRLRKCSDPLDVFLTMILYVKIRNKASLEVTSADTSSNSVNDIKAIQRWFLSKSGQPSELCYGYRLDPGIQNSWYIE